MATDIGMCTCGNCRWCGYRPGCEPATPWRTDPAARPWPAVPLVPGTYTFTPYEPRLSDADVERIARRLAELLRSEGTP